MERMSTPLRNRRRRKVPTFAGYSRFRATSSTLKIENPWAAAPFPANRKEKFRATSRTRLTRRYSAERSGLAVTNAKRVTFRVWERFGKFSSTASLRSVSRERNGVRARKYRRAAKRFTEQPTSNRESVSLTVPSTLHSGLRQLKFESNSIEDKTLSRPARGKYRIEGSHGSSRKTSIPLRAELPLAPWPLHFFRRRDFNLLTRLASPYRPTLRYYRLVLYRTG